MKEPTKMTVVGLCISEKEDEKKQKLSKFKQPLWPFKYRFLS